MFRLNSSKVRESHSLVSLFDGIMYFNRGTNRWEFEIFDCIMYHGSKSSKSAPQGRSLFAHHFSIQHWGNRERSFDIKVKPYRTLDRLSSDQLDELVVVKSLTRTFKWDDGFVVLEDLAMYANQQMKQSRKRKSDRPLLNKLSKR